MLAPWPPPIDLESIQQLVRQADPEGYLAKGAPADEYEPEENLLLVSLAPLPSRQMLVINLLPVIEEVWRSSFALDDEALEDRRPALMSLATQIERFFGPAASPQVRNA
jgi:hypothetical protein